MNYLILKLPNSKEVQLRYDSWDNKYIGHICYDYDKDKLNHKDYGVNRIANYVAEQFQSPQYSYYLEFMNSILTIYVTKYN